MFDKTRGHKRTKARLQGLLETERIPSAMLFHGLEGIGKTRLAYEFAQALLCPSTCGLCSDCQAVEKGLHPDVKAVNASYQAALEEEEAAKQRTLKVATIRHLRRDMELQSLLGKWKVAVIEEAQTMEVEASNALLKILEEPPPRTLWILVATQKDRLPKTVVSRCFSIPFSPLSAPDVAALLVEKGLDRPRAQRLAELAEGSVSRALQLSESPLDALQQGPIGPLAAADALPRELYNARVEVELSLFALAQDARLKLLKGEAAFSDVEPALRELGRLRQALRSNADPKAILALAGLAAQGPR